MNHQSKFLNSVPPAFALIAFAANSILCRICMRGSAFASPLIDPLSFTSIRIVSGAVFLTLITLIQAFWFSSDTGNGMTIENKRFHFGGSWISALSLFSYATFFSIAYVNLTAGTGALILFGSVQASMIGWGVFKGLKTRVNEWIGLILALLGLLYLTSPGLAAPNPIYALYMAFAGISWGTYSLIGKKYSQNNPLHRTAGNFVLASLLVIVLIGFLLFTKSWHITQRGVGLAMLSGAIASGLGYVIWYYALKKLHSMPASIIQLAVPVLTALAGQLLLGESFTLRLFISSLFILIGIGVVVLVPRNHP